MNKKTIKKALLLTVCAILLVVASVMGTLAYLTDKDTVTNTFTAGKVGISMDEKKVDKYGAVVAPETRVQSNEYILVPGRTYTKDPVVHVDANSENSYIFVRIDNTIANYEETEDAYDTIIEQITANWTLVDDTTNVYYKTYEKTDSEVNIPVFSSFKIEETLDNGDIPAGPFTVVVTAYAIQDFGFASPEAAWAQLINKYPLS